MHSTEFPINVHHEPLFKKQCRMYWTLNKNWTSWRNMKERISLLCSDQYYAQIGITALSHLLGWDNYFPSFFQEWIDWVIEILEITEGLCHTVQLMLTAQLVDWQRIVIISSQFLWCHHQHLLLINFHISVTPWWLGIQSAARDKGC